MRLALLSWFAVIGPLLLPSQKAQADEGQAIEKSSYFAFVDRDYIFTLEVVKPGVPLLNFVSMADQDCRLIAKYIRLALENRNVTAGLLVIETASFQQPMQVASLLMHPRSSFGIRLEGDFGGAKEFYGATIRLENEELKLVPLTKFNFEALVLKVNRLNLGSPDFSDDFRVLDLERMGSRSPARKFR